MGSFRTFLQEGLRLTATHSNGDRTAKVYRDVEWEEHRVKHFVGGVHQHKADYHTNDKEEAHNHAKSWAHKTGVHSESVDESFTHYIGKAVKDGEKYHVWQKSPEGYHYEVQHTVHKDKKHIHRGSLDDLQKLGYKPIKEEVMVNEKIVNSKEALEKAIAAAERKAENAKATQQKNKESSYVEMLKSALRRIKGKKNLSAKDVGVSSVTTEDTEKYEPSHAEEGKVKRAARIKFKKKYDKQNESVQLVSELSKKVLSSYRTKAMGQLKAGKGPLKGKDEKRFNGVARSIKEDQFDAELDAIYEADQAFHSQDEFTKHAHASGHVVRTILRGSNAHIHAKHMSSGKTHGLFDVKKEHGVYSTSPLHVDECFDGDELVLESEGMSDAAHELVLHADNDSHMHHSSHQPIISNLKKKAKKGTYDSEKAKKLWKHHADRAAQSYHKTHGVGTAHKWHDMFTTHDRHQAASHWEVHHRHEVHND